MGRAANVGHKACLGYELYTTGEQAYTGAKKLASGDLWGLADLSLAAVSGVGFKNSWRTPKARVASPGPVTTALDGISSANPRSGTFFRSGGVLDDLPPADAGRMLAIAKRQARRLGIDPSEVHGITNLGGSATGATMGGRIHLDPRAFREVYDSRLGRTVSPIENLKRNLIHEHAHVQQSKKHPDLYWSGTAASRQELEKVAYRFEDFWYGAIQRHGTGR